MSVASSSTSDDDHMLSRINNLLEPELRSVLQHIALVHPEVVQAALKHQQFFGDDVHSVMTEQISNTRSKHEENPPLILREISGGHPSKGGTADTDEVTMPQPRQTRHPQQQQRPSIVMPPPVPQRRGVSPPASISSSAAPPRRRLSPPQPPASLTTPAVSRPKRTASGQKSN